MMLSIIIFRDKKDNFPEIADSSGSDLDREEYCEWTFLIGDLSSATWSSLNIGTGASQSPKLKPEI